MTEQMNHLVRQAQAGRAEAAGQLYEACVKRIHRYLYFATGDATVAEDLTAQVFLKMVQYLAAYRSGEISFIAWLFQIARNQAIDHHRHKGMHPSQSLSESHPQPAAHPETQAEVNQQSSELAAALARLPQDQRDVVLMRFIDGLPIRETANSLHRSEDAIKGLQRRALIHLRNILETGENQNGPTG